MMWFIPIGVILVLGIIWSAGFLVVNDFAVASRSPSRPLRTMAVFPHADDETITSGGTISRLARLGGPVALLLLTQGELGTPDGQGRPGLVEEREQEAARAARLLGIDSVVRGGFPDGELASGRSQVTAWLAGEIEAWRPELLITFDLAGLYQHPDHVACAEILTQLQSTRFPQIALWYGSLPDRLLLTMVRLRLLPSGSDHDPRRSRPTHKVFVGGDLLAKIRAWNAYASQRESLRWGLGRFVPPWLFLSVLLFEYFAAVPALGSEP
ncbi:MAG: PIG-L deacetylase family protein [Candidatus Dormibacteria bacterium]